MKITVVAGELHGHKAPPPPPHSWASKPEADVALLHGEMQPGASFSLPPPRTSGAVRTLYVFSGGPLMVGSNDEKIQTSNGGVLESSSESIVLKAGSERVSWLLLQGKPIDEPVQQHGPFVMNTASEIQQVQRLYHLICCSEECSSAADTTGCYTASCMIGATFHSNSCSDTVATASPVNHSNPRVTPVYDTCFFIEPNHQTVVLLFTFSTKHQQRIECTATISSDHISLCRHSWTTEERNLGVGLGNPMIQTTGLPRAGSLTMLMAK